MQQVDWIMPDYSCKYLFVAIALATLSLGGVLAPAAASEDAHLRIIGFSEDGSHFAFEEYGLQAGSGSPFTSLYVVDLPADRWVPGTPFRGNLPEGGFDEREAYGHLATIRAEVAEEASALLTRLSIRMPASVVYARGMGDHAGQSALSTVRFPFIDMPLGARASAQFDLHLEAIPAPSPLDYCMPQTMGYRLTLLWPGAAPVVLHEDSRVPRSRGCPRAYRLSHFLVPDTPNCPPQTCPDGPLGVALISVFADGFEGLGRRFIAAPVPLTAPAR